MIVQLLQVRKILESWAAAEACRQATDEDLRALERDERQGLDQDPRRSPHRPFDRTGGNRLIDMRTLSERGDCGGSFLHPRRPETRITGLMIEAAGGSCRRYSPERINIWLRLPFFLLSSDC